MANKLFSQLSKGAYDNATAYTVGDFINYLGSSYACIKNGTGNLPTNTTYWALLSSKGDKGDKGNDGADGSNGACVESVAFVGDDMVFTLTDASTVTIVGAKTDLKGEQGLDVTWLGEYNAGTTYVVNDAVSYNGSSYICKLESTGNLPTNTTYFDLMARKGTDGAGSGDVIAPATNTDSYIPQWDGANSKTLKDGLGLDTDLSSVSANDDTVPSAKATKTYADSKVEDSIVDGHTTIAPSGNAVFDALAGKQATMTKATQAEVATGTDDTKYVTPLAVQPYSNNSLYRQAIINGNFDVWQRGTSLSAIDATYNSDRWIYLSNESGATSNISRQTFTPQTTVPNNPVYYLKINQTVAGSGASYKVLSQRIENIVRYNNKTFTVSFWAKIATGTANILISFDYNYGSGGSSSEFAKHDSGNKSIGTTWTKITHTFTTDDISSKTIGANSYLQLNISLPLNATFNIDIAQVQLNAGSVALPFQPKSYAEELRDCQRYFQLVGVGYVGLATGSTTVSFFGKYNVPMRTTPTISLTSTTPSVLEVNIANRTGSGSTIIVNPATSSGFKVDLTGFTGFTEKNVCIPNTDFMKFDAEL